MSSRIKQTIYASSPEFVRPYLQRLQASSIARRLAHGAFWSVFGAVISRVLILGSFIAIARIMGKEGYGRFGIIQSTVSMFGIFAGFGLAVTANKHVAQFREIDPVRAGRIMGMAGMVAAITGFTIASALFILAPWLASNTLNDPNLTGLLRIGSVVLFFEAMNGAQTGALGGFEAFRTSAKISIAFGLISCPLMIAGVLIAGLPGSVWALALKGAINWLLNHLALRKVAAKAGVPICWRGCSAELPLVWRFSLPAVLGSIVVSPTLWVCNAFLVNQPDGYGQMGILQANRVIQQALLYIGTVVSAPLLPMLSNAIGSGQESNRLGRVNILSTWAIGSLPAMVLISLPELGVLMFGHAFSSNEFANTYILILLGTSILLYRNGLSRVLITRGMMWWGVTCNVVWAVTMIALAYLFIPLGAMGYALAWALSYALNTVIFVPLYTKKKLVPLGTLISLEAAGIWLAMGVATALALLHTSLLLRLAALPVLVAVVCLMFWRMLMRGPVQTTTLQTEAANRPRQ